MDVLTIVWMLILYLTGVAITKIFIDIEEAIKNPFVVLLASVFWPITGVLSILYIGIWLTGKDCIKYIKEQKEEKRNE